MPRGRMWEVTQERGHEWGMDPGGRGWGYADVRVDPVAKASSISKLVDQYEYRRFRNDRLSRVYLLALCV
jgi:hypothetical protein